MKFHYSQRTNDGFLKTCNLATDMSVGRTLSVPAAVPGSGPVTPSRSYSSIINESNEPNNSLKVLTAPATLSLKWSALQGLTPLYISLSLMCLSSMTSCRDFTLSMGRMSSLLFYQAFSVFERLSLSALIA